MICFWRICIGDCNITFSSFTNGVLQIHTCDTFKCSDNIQYRISISSTNIKYIKDVGFFDVFEIFQRTHMSFSQVLYMYVVANACTVIESAFVEALKYQSDIYQQAIEKNILVATPTTLLTSLNIVKQLWRFEEQTKYSKELANRAERFYNKLNGFLTSMEGVGKQLDRAKESYDKAFSQLYRGKGNLIKQASEFKELGVSVQKELPNESVEKAQLELD